MSSFSLNNKTIQSKANQSLFDLVRKLSTPIPSSCKKQGKCKECLIEIKSGSEFLSPLTKAEQHLLPQYRLACQTFIEKDGEVKAENIKRSLIKIEEKGIGLTSGFKIEPAVYRKGNLVFIDDEVIAQTTGLLLGLAVDIGTTTVVVRLIDIEKGKIKATASFENPQFFAGTNVMARIVYDTEHGKKELKRIFTAHLSNTILSICDRPENIFEVMIGGNTTMRDLFFGLNVFTIGQTPYKSLTEFDIEKGKKETTAIQHNAKKMQLPIHPKARIYGLPIIGGHVGADTSACLLAIQLMEEDKVIAFMDIGTNTEIIIGNKHKAITASSPSGPAFEGGGIACGMPALEGAIENVQITDNGNITIKTVNNKSPVGICGSGLIDILGELTRTKRISEVGRFEDDIECLYLDTKQHIFINEYDINLLSQTKAANIAALQILFKEYGLAFNEVDTFYLAGGFGEYIDIEAGIRIGLLPNIPREKFKKIGNATIEGLTIALLSKTKRAALEKFVTNIRQVNLETDPDFFDHFVEGCLFHEII
jgi:uncharacterized 2Fe-2S/4Fe-4S cluster protein (DUF4445 family)